MASNVITKAERKKILLSEVGELEKFSKKLTESPESYVSEKLNSINNHLSRVKPRKPTNSGNISMYEHLQNLKKKWEENGSDMVNELKTKTENRLQLARAEITNIEDDE